MATKIVRDNCKDCTSSCEHAGKDREFVYVKGVSCKTVKPKPEMVAVVRCKDCKHSWQDISGLCCSHGVCVDCTVPEDFFCAEGERKNDFVDDNKIGERKFDENEPLGT